MLQPEAPQAEVVGVPDNGFGHADEPAPLRAPPLAQLPVLGGRALIARLECTGLDERNSGKRHVVAGEEPRVGRIGVVVVPEKRHEGLAGFGVPVSVKGVDNRAPGARSRMRVERGYQRAQPARLGHAVVIEERDVRTPRQRDALVPRGRRS